MFSIVIPLYNKANYIEKAVRSVFSQTFKEFELTIVNDGSTDESNERLIQLKSLGFYFEIIDQENSGVSIARNNGVKQAGYDFIAFLDADDWWEPTYLEEMKKLTENCPDAGLYSSNFSKIKNGEKLNSRLKFDFDYGYIDYFRLYITEYRQFIFPTCAIIPKNVYNKMGGFHSSISRGEDFHFWIRIALQYKIAYLNKQLANYNQDSDATFRATKKIHSPDKNYVFYFSEFKKFEKSNPNLKALLDHIRIGNFEKYVSYGLHQEKAKELIEEVNFITKPWYYELIYKSSPLVIRSYISIKKHLKKIIKLTTKFSDKH